MDKNIVEKLNVCDVTKLQLYEFQAEGYFDAVHDLVDMIDRKSTRLNSSHQI